MEPFEVATGVVGVVSLIIQITQTIVQLGLDWKEAPDNVKASITELQALKTVLSETNTNLTVNPEFANAFGNQHSAVLSQMGAMGSSPSGITALVEMCNNELNDLLKELRRRSEKHERRLSWERVKSAFLAKTMRESMENLHRQCQILNSLVLVDTAALGAATYNEVKEARTENQIWQQSEETRQVIAWLSQVDSGAQLSDHLRQRQEGTGTWIFDTDQYQTWLASDQSTLFCPGVPGAGKTIATSIVIDELYRQFQNDKSVGITFAFCTFQQRDAKKEDILASLLKQLICKSASLPSAVKDLYSDHARIPRRPSYDALSKALRTVVSQLSKSFIIVDALDEGWFPGGALNRIISTVFELQGECPINFLATSRFIPDIAAEFKDAGSSFLEIRANDLDIVKYLEGNTTELPAFVSRNHELWREILNSIVHVVDGMFLLAHLHLGSLKGKRSVKAIRTALQDLPRGSNAYDEAYKKTMTRIEGQVLGQIELAKQVLAWIACAKRRLSKIELQHALAVEIGEPEFDEDNLPDINMMVSVCAGLVAVDESSESIRLVHYTTQEYFDRTWETWFPTVHHDIAETCVTYLSFDMFNEGVCYFDGELEARLSKFPLYDYSAKNWGHHAREQSIEKQLVMGLLESEPKVLACSQCQGLSLHKVGSEGSEPNRHMHPMIRNRFSVKVSMPEDQETVNPVWGTFLAAHFGLESIMKVILDKDAGNAKLRDAFGRTPLCCAAGSGNLPTIRLLLEKKADINSCDNKGYFPLLQAVLNHNEHAALLLLQKGADTECRKSGFCPSLPFAAWRGNIAITRVLLENGANPRSRTKRGLNALLAAVYNGRLDIAKLLLQAGADPDAEGYLRLTPLSAAVLKGCEAMIRLLLEHRANINHQEASGRTPLGWAAGKGMKHLVDLLIKNGADPEPKNSGSESPLSISVQNGHAEVVRFLLGIGVAADPKDKDGKTPLFHALRNDDKDVAKMLLEKGADPNSKDRDGQSLLLRLASMNCRKEVLEFLVESGADANVRDKRGRTLLCLATEWNYAAVLRLLIDKGVEVETTDTKGETLLMKAVKHGHRDEVESLLEKGANPNHRGRNRTPPLSEAASGCHDCEDVVKVLLLRGADPHFKDQDGRTPLSLAAENGHKAIVKLLLGWGAELESADANGATPLMKAATTKEPELVEMLLDKGANPNAKDKHDTVPLAYAVLEDSAGSEAVIDVLLKKGADPNWATIESTTILHLLFEGGVFFDKELALVTRRLLENGAEPDLRDNNGQTPLSLIIRWSERKEIIDLLLEYGADPNSRDQDGRTPFSKMAQTGFGYDGYDDDDDDEEEHEIIETLKLLLDKGADPASKDNSGRNPLSWAAAGDDDCYKAVDFLLKMGTDVESPDYNGRTALSWAAAERDGECLCVDLLLTGGANPDSRDHRGRSPLSWAMSSRYHTHETMKMVVHILLEEGCDPDSRDDQGRGPLSYAAMGERFPTEVVQMLLNRGAYPDAMDHHGRSPLSYAAVQLGAEGVFNTLLEQGASPNSKDDRGRGPISYAAARNFCSNIVEKLLQREVDLDFPDLDGRTPLSWAASCKENQETVKLLLDNGANPNTVDSHGRSPLSYAATCSSEIVELLLQGGADTNTKDLDGRSSLTCAAQRGMVGAAESLLQGGSEVDSKDKDGRTPLLWAADLGRHLAMVPLLLAKGAEADSPDDNGRTPLSWAVTTHSTLLERNEVVNLLLEKGVDANSRDAQGRTPFYWAALSGHKSAAELLLNKNADRHLGDYDGSTPLSVAKEKGWDRVVKLILDIQDDLDIIRDNDPDNFSYTRPSRPARPDSWTKPSKLRGKTAASLDPDIHEEHELMSTLWIYIRDVLNPSSLAALVRL